MNRRVWSGALVVSLSVGMVVGAAPSASFAASVPTSVPAATPPDFTPSGNSAKKWALNILGSVLGGAMPNKWRAEQLANQYRYGNSFEGLNAQFGYSSRYGDGSPMPAPGDGTYDDYMIAKAERAMQSKPFRPPATKMMKFTKTVGGVAVGMTGYSMSAAFGSGVIDVFFEDANGLVCAKDVANGNGLLSMMTGRDCSAFEAAAEYVVNADSAMGWAASGPLCSGSVCSTFLGFAYTVEATPMRRSCWITTGGSAFAIYQYSLRASDSSMQKAFTGQSSPTDCTGTYGGSTHQTTAHSDTTTYPIVYGYSATGGAAPEVTLTGTHSDPARTFDCTVTGNDGLTYTAATDEFTEAGAWLTPVCPTLPPGVLPQSVGVEECTVGGSCVPVGSETVTPEFTDSMVAYPECADGSCMLDLVSVPDQASCFELADGACADWFADPDKAITYLCRYGDHDVALSECNAYARVFTPAATTAGSAYADPTTGLWSGGQSSPAAASGFMAATVQDPEVDRQCLPSGWAVLNPVEWVMRPVQCALEWAFVPRPAVVAFEAETARTSWAGTSVVQVASVAGNLGTLVGELDGDCQGPPVTFGEGLATFGLSGTHYPLTACEGTAATLAGVSRASAVGTVGLFALFSMLHFFGVSIGFTGFGRGGRDS